MFNVPKGVHNKQSPPDDDRPDDDRGAPRFSRYLCRCVGYAKEHIQFMGLLLYVGLLWASLEVPLAPPDPAGIDMVLVIGAGPAGITMLQQLSEVERDRPVRFECWEQQPSLGGLWTGLAPFSGMYEGMWINGDKSFVEFASYTYREHFGHEPPSFLPRRAVTKYLHAYVTRFKLKQHMTFGVRVTSVRYERSRSAFRVESMSVDHAVHKEDAALHVSGSPRPTKYFKFVAVATGTFTVPLMPPLLPGFTGKQMHAQQWRGAAGYVGKTVVIVGDGDSAREIAMLLIRHGAKRVVMSFRHYGKRHNLNVADAKRSDTAAGLCVHHSLTRCKSFIGLSVRPGLMGGHNRTVHFSRSTSPVHNVDTIIFATGYKPDGPHQAFMEEALQPGHGDQLHLNVLWRDQPRLMYLNNGCHKFQLRSSCVTSFNFAHMEAKAAYAARVAALLLPLPSVNKTSSYEHSCQTNRTDRLKQMSFEAVREARSALFPEDARRVYGFSAAGDDERLSRFVQAQYDEWSPSFAFVASELCRQDMLLQAAGVYGAAGYPDTDKMLSMYAREFAEYVLNDARHNTSECPCRTSWYDSLATTRDVRTRGTYSSEQPPFQAGGMRYAELLDTRQWRPPKANEETVVVAGVGRQTRYQ